MLTSIINVQKLQQEWEEQVLDPILLLRFTWDGQLKEL